MEEFLENIKKELSDKSHDEIRVNVNREDLKKLIKEYQYLQTESIKLIVKRIKDL